ncbi:efflux RND transporter periplasmic adaptor subunit [Marinovum sp.]|uniref:efflux RND transporter periplasmic adaptor subunit n=1 Tax=Marinovum sp. TaxID=2024839 RepID=UPI002B2726CB|nr:efflux RND transporter periplasmic adaptor subunit [Marinovum sp.]
MKRFAEALLGLAAIAAVTYWLFGERLAPYLGAEAPVAEAAATGAGGGRPGGRPGAGRAALVTLETVEITAYAEAYQTVGTIEAEARVAVVSEVSGRVEEVFVAAGDRVAAGAPLLRLEQRTQELDLATAEVQLATATDTLKRVQQLTASGSSAVTSVQEQEALTAANLAQVTVDRATFERDRRTLRAPIAGVVGLMDARLGDYLTAGGAITTVSAPEQLLVDFALPESAVPVLAEGMALDVLLPSRIGQVFTARVTAIDTEIDPETRLIDVEARLEGDVSGLRHGMIANVVLAQEQAPMPAIPALAISWSRTGASVFVADEGTARSVPVTIRHRLDDRVWVSADLAAGDRVVVEGVQKVRAGGELAEAGGGRPERPGGGLVQESAAPDQLSERAGQGGDVNG